MVVDTVQTFDSPIDRLIDADTSLFFSIEEGDQVQLGVSNGTASGTSIFNLDGGAEEFLGVNGRVFFDGFTVESGTEPFINNGTADGTVLLSDINPNNDDRLDDPLNFTRVGDFAYFTAFNEENGLALYRSDVTQDNTTFVADISDEAGNPFDELVDFNGTLYFSGNDGENGREIWSSNGTDETTQSVTNFEQNSLISNLTATEEHLYFTRGGFDPDLWRTDGTEGGTQLLAEDILPESLTSVGNTLYFSANDGVTGRELWTSDGTAEGTQLFEDILIADRDGNRGSDPENLTDVDGRLFFTADDGGTGRELWISDGTEEGTQRVADLTPEEGSTRFSKFTEADGKLYFIKNGDELWQSRGTAASTFQIEPEQIDLGGTTTPEFQNPEQLIEFEDQLYFTGESYDPNTGEYVPALLTEEDSNTVFRLRNPAIGNHFYTTSAAERDEAINSGEFDFESESFSAVDPTAEGAEEVYRFFNESQNVYLYTTSETERENIQANDSRFTFQGEVFNAYETQVEGSIPIYRFLNTDLDVHFYTPSAEERDIVEETLPSYQSEGIAYYAFPLEDA